MSFLAVLPIAGYGLFVAIARSRGSGRRSSAIHAAAVWGVVALVLTETLSAVHALTAAGLAVGWLAVDVAAGAWLARSIPSFVPGAFAKLGGLERAFVAAMLATLAVAGLVAVAAPPNTTDAMVYHLPRIVHWLENRTVAFYPTHELKQLRMAPWAEYAMLQVHALSGGDRLDNLVEWFSFAGSLLGVSLIAGRLGAGLRGQVLAAALCATLPSAVLEASSAKNDCVAGFWLVAMAYYLLCFVGKQTTGSLLGFGCALGLALLTKSTLWVSAPAVIAFLAIPMGWRMRSLAPAVLLALALNAPHLIRNYALFHAPFGPAAEIPPRGFKYTNDRFGVGPAASNILRNVALHATTPWQPLNRVTEAGVRGALRLLHEDPDDPATTWDFTAVSRSAIQPTRGHRGQSAACVPDSPGLRTAAGRTGGPRRTGPRCCWRRDWRSASCCSAWCSSGSPGTRGCTCRYSWWARRFAARRWRGTGRVGRWRRWARWCSFRRCLRCSTMRCGRSPAAPDGISWPRRAPIFTLPTART